MTVLSIFQVYISFFHIKPPHTFCKIEFTIFHFLRFCKFELTKSTEMRFLLDKFYTFYLFMAKILFYMNYHL